MLSATIEQLRAVALGASDASGYFPAMYARVTERVQQATVDGRFGDGERMVRFATAFADWYLRPRAGTPPIPGSWQAAWDVAGDGKLLIVQHLLLGINAHVNHDLPQVVVELADAPGPQHGDIDTLRADFDAINTVLAETLPDVVRDTGRVSRWVGAASAWGGGRLFNFSLEVARRRAWEAAVRIHREDAETRRTDVAELDRLVRVIAYLVTKPSVPVSWVVPLARRLEERDPPTVTRSLLGQLA